MNRHGLSQEVINRISEVLAGFENIDQAILFGSRAKGTQKPGSDIDLALAGSALNWRVLGKIADTLDDLLLPYRFSLVVYNDKTDPEVAAHIRRVGIPLFNRRATNENALKR